jgi:hypothetical protein
MALAALFAMWIALLAAGLGFMAAGLIWPSDTSMNYLVVGATILTMGAYAMWKDFVAPLLDSKKKAEKQG